MHFDKLIQMQLHAGFRSKSVEEKQERYAYRPSELTLKLNFLSRQTEERTSPEKVQIPISNLRNQVSNPYEAE
jgi:hypothetical protein